jgi:hypothetical protein
VLREQVSSEEEAANVSLTMYPEKSLFGQSERQTDIPRSPENTPRIALPRSEGREILLETDGYADGGSS